MQKADNTNPNLKIGTCSWKYPDWEGIVYSKSKDINFLQEYSRKYNTVEIDQWFWSLFDSDTAIKLPKPSDVKNYRQSVPDDFRFSVKVPNAVTLTHFYKKKKADPFVPNPSFLSPDVFQEFLRLLEPIHDVLGPLIFQFEYLNKQKMGSQKQFLDMMEGFIRGIPSRFEYAIETRNPYYLNGKYFEFSQMNGLSPVFLQGYWMPSIVDVFKKWWKQILGFKTVVIRLHGPNRQEIEKLTGGKWNQIVLPKDKELDEIAGIVSELMKNGVLVYVNVNNHYEGCAPETIDRMVGRLEG